jgi:D-3-phosphoglycerate dehydrogenase / 2-oxoglutarate reductase
MAVAYLDREAIQDIKHNLNVPVFVPRPATSRVTARSEAEFVIGNIFHLARLSPRHMFEVRSKTLGIVGYGSVGIQISSMAEALGMRVLFYDSADVMNYGRAKSTSSLSELLEQADIVTLHVPANTEPMLHERELCQTMRKGSCLIDSSHSRAVDYNALATALKIGHIAGAAVDLPLGSPFSPSSSIPNLLLSHNVRHATQEVSDAVAKEVLTDLSLYLDQLNVPRKPAFHEDRSLEQPIPQPTMAK